MPTIMANTGNGYLDELILDLFTEKLQDKNQHPFQNEEASRAVRFSIKPS